MRLVAALLYGACLLLICCPCSAQKRQNEKTEPKQSLFDGAGSFIDLIFATKDKLDTNYVRYFEKRWSPRAYVESKTLSFGFRSRDITDKEPEQYYPNNGSNIGVALFYEGLGLGFSLSVGNKNARKQQILGKTSFFDTQLNSYKNRFGLDLYLQNYRGFYIGEAGFFYPSNNVAKPYTQREDLRIFQTGFNYYRVLNSTKYSLQAPFIFAKKQVKSGGSFMWMGAFNYQKMYADSAIQSISAENENRQVAFTKGNFFYLAGLPGYGHTFIWRSWFIGAAGFIGPGLQYQNYVEGANTRSKVSALAKANLRGGVGYNGRDWFAGITGLIDLTQNYAQGIKLQTRNDVLRASVGFRF